jgi:hypothetical protein
MYFITVRDIMFTQTLHLTQYGLLLWDVMFAQIAHLSMRYSEWSLFLMWACEKKLFQINQKKTALTQPFLWESEIQPIT